MSIEINDDMQAILDVAAEMDDGEDAFDMPGLFSAEELAELIHDRETRTEWGAWRYRADNLTLELSDDAGRYLYYLDLEHFKTSAEMLDMIFQVAGKTWATDKIIADMIHALDDLLAPQANLCSSGMNKRIKPQKILLARGAGK